MSNYIESRRTNTHYACLITACMSLLTLNHLVSSVYILAAIAILVVLGIANVRHAHFNKIAFMWLINVFIILIRTSTWDSSTIKINLSFIIGLAFFVFFYNVDFMKMLFTSYNKFFSFLIISSVILQLFITGNIFQIEGGERTGITSHSYHLLLYCFIVVSYSVFICKNKRLGIICIIVCTLAVMISGSRSNLVTIPLSVLIVYLFSKNDNKMILRVFKIIFLIGIIIGLFMFIGERFQLPSYQRIQDSIDRVNTGRSITNGRTVIQNRAIEDFHNHPLLGIGWMNFRVLHSSTGDLGSNAHNFYLQVFCELGIIQGLFFLMPLISELFIDLAHLKKRKNKNNSEFYLFCFCVSYQVYYLLSSYFHATSYDAFYIILYFCCMTVCTVIRSGELSEKSE